MADLVANVEVNVLDVYNSAPMTVRVRCRHAWRLRAAMTVL
jgi:hypothetical protein